VRARCCSIESKSSRLRFTQDRPAGAGGWGELIRRKIGGKRPNTLPGVLVGEPALHTRLPFGKHRGERFDAVPEDYLRWIVEGQNELREEIKHSAGTGWRSGSAAMLSMSHRRDVSPRPLLCLGKSSTGNRHT